MGMRNRKPTDNGKGDWPRPIKLLEFQKNFDGIDWGNNSADAEEKDKEPKRKKKS